MTPINQQLIKKPVFPGLSLIHNCSRLVFNLLASAPPPYRVRAQASILVHGHHPHVSVIDERAVTGGLNYQSQAP